MQTFHCAHCQHLLFFENVQCVRCGHTLAYLLDLDVVSSLDPTGDGMWQSPLPPAAGRRYRLCQNYTQANVCNWAVPASDPQPLCWACRFTQVLPDLRQPGHHTAWYRLEVAKRRLLYSLRHLGVPLVSKADDPAEGLAFAFLADSGEPGAAPVLTGHANGVITIHVAEADDVERERRRQQLHEPSRTLLGHVRHESGHYYWERLLQQDPRLDAFRALFGDERVDYGQTLQQHYQHGAPADWPERFVSAYASAHPWEDWAETWAHYLHMTDALETAVACGLALQPLRPDEPAVPPLAQGGRLGAFAERLQHWFALTYVLNNLNRSLGVPDAYPFILAPPVLDKLRFVHDTIAAG
jgi:hypothetical protein